MNRHVLSTIMLLASVVFLCCCTAVEEKKGQIAPVTEKGMKLAPSIAELKRLYESANSEYDRRAVCLRAIDEGAIRRGAPISSIDEIFGTHFAGDLPNRQESFRSVAIDFAKHVAPPQRPNIAMSAHDYVGWFVGFQYDPDGKIQNYSLTNVHKGPGKAVS